jgi:hypothetical protein
MEKNSPTYNNKRFAQRTDNYEDYERNTSIPAPAAGQGFLGLQNTNEFMWNAFRKTSPWMRQEFYMESISNAKAFLNSSAYGSEFKSQISKFISYMTTLNGGVQPEADGPKRSWLSKNKNKGDQYNEFTNWSQSERQKYSDRFEAITGPRKDLLQKALVALKNAEIAAAKDSYPNNPGVQAAEYMSEAKAEDKPEVSAKPSNKPSAESKPAEVAQKPQKTYEKFNYSYIPFIKKIKTANDLLFFSAMQALGMKAGEYSKENESSYYTKDNHNKIQAEVNKIADSEYLNKINPLLSKLKQAALDKLFDKVGGLDVKPPAETTDTTSDNGPLTTTHDEQGQTHFESNTRTEQGDKIRELFDAAYQIEREDPSQLKSLWKNLRLQILALMRSNELDPKERIEFEDKLKDLDLKYNLAFHPEGGQQLSSGAFVVNTPEALARILRAALEVDDVTAANDAVDKLKIIFEENPRFRDYQILRRQLAIEINQYNFGKDETVKKL